MSRTELWFCPICAAELTGHPGTLHCKAGACSFSEAITKELVASRATKLSPVLFAQGNAMGWYCPTCSHQLNWGEVSGSPVFGCPECGTYLPARVQHQLLEYHNHAPLLDAL